eukprot:3641122-Karenia_brevis.AAC.1
MEGIPALASSELVIKVFAPILPKTIDVKEKIYATDICSVLRNVDHVPPSLPPSHWRARLMILKDNDPVLEITEEERRGR